MYVSFIALMVAQQPTCRIFVFHTFKVLVPFSSNMSDPRFARLKTDPRFRRPKKQQSKIVVDDRFKSVFAPSKNKKSKGKSGWLTAVSIGCLALIISLFYHQAAWINMDVLSLMIMIKKT